MDPSPTDIQDVQGRLVGSNEDAGCPVQKEVAAEVYKTVNSPSNGKSQPSYLLFLIIQEQRDGKASP